jgi:hypothetical protein
VLYQLSYTRALSIEGKNDASEAQRIKKYLPAVERSSAWQEKQAGVSALAKRHPLRDLLAIVPYKSTLFFARRFPVLRIRIA